MHTDKDFLRSICENPEDDHTRLVFADWLDENGHPNRAAMIRWCIETGCQYVRSPSSGCWYREHSGPGDPPQSERVQGDGMSGCKFLDPEPVWKGLEANYDGLPGVTLFVKKGFVYAIKSPPQTFKDAAGMLLSRQPITNVELEGRWPRTPANTDVSHWASGPFDESRHFIHSSIFHTHLVPLAGGTGREEGNRYTAGFVGHQRATIALSMACVNYGRSRAGLPILYQRMRG